MIRAGFDYRPVWAGSLWQRRVTVHNRPRLEQRRLRVRDRRDDVRTVESLVTCGTRPYEAYDVDSDGLEILRTWRPYGVILCVSHAVAIGAHFCRNCWPEGTPA